MATLTSDWLKHFHLRLCNCWMEFDETLQEARTIRRLPTLQVCVFWANGKTKMTTLASYQQRLFLWNSLIEFGKIWKEVRTQYLQPRLFLANPKTKMAALASYWWRHFCASASDYCIHLWICRVLFPPCRYLRLICSVLNSPTLQICYIIRNVLFNWSSFKFTFKPEGKKGKNKTAAKISLYTVAINKGCTWYSGARYKALLAFCF